MCRSVPRRIALGFVVWISLADSAALMLQLEAVADDGWRARGSRSTPSTAEPARPKRGPESSQYQQRPAPEPRVDHARPDAHTANPVAANPVATNPVATNTAVANSVAPQRREASRGQLRILVGPEMNDVGHRAASVRDVQLGTSELTLSPTVAADDFEIPDWVAQVAAIPCGPDRRDHGEKAAHEPMILKRLPAPSEPQPAEPQPESATVSPLVELMPPTVAANEQATLMHPDGTLSRGPRPLQLREHNRPRRPAVEAAVSPSTHACAACGRPGADCECQQTAPAPADIWRGYQNTRRVARPFGRAASRTDQR